MDQVLEEEYARTLAEVERLDNVEDPHTEPYKSKYEGRRLVNDMAGKLQEHLCVVRERESAGGEEDELLDRLALMDLHLGINHTMTEEFSSGEKYLMKALERLRDRRDVFVPDLLRCLNHLAILWSMRGEGEKSLEFLQEAQVLYQTNKGEKSDHLEHLYTLTTFYLAQAYANGGQPALAAEYCHTTLKRQLREEYDVVEWVKNCIGMSEYYLTVPDDPLVHHLLQAAEVVSETKNAPEDIRARLALAKGRYFLRRLKVAYDTKITSEEEGTVQDAPPTSSLIESVAHRFDELGFKDTYQPTIRGFDEARTIFKQALYWFGVAREYYVLDGFVSDHVAIAQDTSTLYKYLAAFDTEPGRRVAMHKRRREQLKPLLGVLNPKVYSTLDKQIVLEMASIHADIFDARVLCGHRGANLDAVAREALGLYDQFLTSFTRKQHEGQETNYEGMDQGVLVAHFQKARLYSRLAPSDRGERIANLERSLSEYVAITQFAQHAEIENKEEQLSVCTQMIELLPQKINAMKAGVPM